MSFLYVNGSVLDCLVILSPNFSSRGIAEDSVYVG